MVARSATIADLKNNLSSYLGDVRRGEEILVCDRNVPIAKIIPLPRALDFDAEETALAAEGKLRLPEGPLPASLRLGESSQHRGLHRDAAALSVSPRKLSLR